MKPLLMRSSTPPASSSSDRKQNDAPSRSSTPGPPGPLRVTVGGGTVAGGTNKDDTTALSSSTTPRHGAENGEPMEDDDESNEKDIFQPPKRLEPTEKDMWNQSLYLPGEFTNPPERPDPHDTREEGEERAAVPGYPPSPHHTSAGLPKTPEQPDPKMTLGSSMTAFSSSTRENERPPGRRRERGVYRYLRTMFNWGLVYRSLFVLLGAATAAIAVLLSMGEIPQPPIASTNGVLLWRWIAFAACLILSIPCSRFVVRFSELALWYAKPKWTTSAYYYVKCCRMHIAFFLTTVGWLVAWYELVYNVAPTSTNPGYFYGAQTFWLFFIASLLVFVARLAREVSASFFERTTFWTQVSENLKREYYLWACCPGCPVASPVALIYHRVGEDAIRNDPRVLRQCTKYLRRHYITAYSNVNVGSLIDPLANVNAPIEIAQEEDMQDLGEVMFDYVWQMIHGPKPIVDEDATRNKLKSMRAARADAGDKEDTAVRAMFSVGQTMYSRAGSSSLFMTPNAEGDIVNESKTPASVNMATSRPLLGPSKPPRVPVQPPKSFRSYGHRRITQQEFEEKMFTRKEDGIVSAEVAWTTIFDPNKRGFCTPKYLKATMTRYYNDRVGLGHTLKDSQSAVDRLGWVYYSIAMLGTIVAAALLFSGSSSYDVWIGITSFFVTLAVVFGSTLKSIAENIVFIFFRHPYDVGDLLFIEGNYFSVRRLELLSTVLIKWNGQYLQRDNYSMSQMEIFNLTRSGLYWEILEAYVDVAVCTTQFLNNVRQHIMDYLQSHPDSFSGRFQMIARSHARPLQIRIGLYIEFAYRPVNITKLFDDIGKLNECFADGLRKFSASEAGVGLGAVRANITEEPVKNLTAAHGLFGRTKAISDALGL